MGGRGVKGGKGRGGGVRCVAAWSPVPVSWSALCPWRWCAVLRACMCACVMPSFNWFVSDNKNYVIVSSVLSRFISLIGSKLCIVYRGDENSLLQ